MGEFKRPLETKAYMFMVADLLRRTGDLVYTTPCKKIQQDLKSINLSLNEAIDVAQNLSHHALLVVYVRNE